MALLEVHRLSFHIGGLAIIENLDLTVEEGEIRCLIGPNGAGKTTLFNLLTGRFRPTGGRIVFAGHDITGLRPHRLARLGIGRKFQVPNVFPDLTLEDNLRIAAAGKSRMAESVRGWGPADDLETVRVLLAEVRLAEKARMRAGLLSHGERQWLEIAMVLINRPRLLLLDEPTAGMTVQETRETASLIRRLSSRLTTLVIEHDISFVREIAERVTVLNRGTRLTEGTLAEVSADERVRQVYLGYQEG